MGRRGVRADSTSSHGRAALGLALAVIMIAGALPAGVAGTAGAGRVLRFAEVGNTSLATFSIFLAPGETTNNTTFYLPLNASSTVLSATLNVTGLTNWAYANLTGYGENTRVYERFGQDLLGGGDYNDDGYTDLAAGAEWGSVGDVTGRADVFYGGPAGFTSSQADWTVHGVPYGHLGAALAFGDFNDDGVDDLALAESGWQAPSPDETIWIYNGSSTGLAPTPAYNLTIGVAGQWDYWAKDVAGNADLDNDGFDDLIVGQPGMNTVHVLWGSAEGLNLSDRTEFSSPGANQFGEHVVSLGDTDGDGYGEFGSASEWNFTFGVDGSAEVLEIGPNRTIESRWNWHGGSNDYSGIEMAGGRDVTGDGLADVLVGCRTTNGTGAVYVFNGTGSSGYAPAPSFNLTPPARLGGAFYGRGLDSAGDYNGDGLADVVVGAYMSANEAGRAFLYLGGHLRAEEALVIEDPIPGQDQQIGVKVAGLGDTNGDGLDDFGVTLGQGINKTTFPGAVWIFNGTAHVLPEFVRIVAGTTTALNLPGILAGTVSVDVRQGMQQFLDAALAAGTTLRDTAVPITVQMSGGGRIVVADITVFYTMCPTPKSFTGSAPPEGGRVLLQWEGGGADITRYVLWTDKTGQWTVLANVSPSNHSYVDLAVSDGVAYSYFLVSVDGYADYQSLPTPTVTVTPRDLTPPAVPGDLFLGAFPALLEFSLSWTRNSDDTVRYEVWRSVGDTGTFEFQANVSGGSSSYRDRGLSEDVNYTYQVRAIDDADLASGFSAAVVGRIRDTTAPAVPTGVAAVSLPSGTGGLVTWNANTDDTVNYAVEISLTNASGSFTLAGRSPTASLAVAGLLRNTTYFVRVYAIDDAGLNSTPSAAVAFYTVDTAGPDAPVITQSGPLIQGSAAALTWTAQGDDIAFFTVYVETPAGWRPAGTFNGALRTGGVLNLVDDVAVSLRLTGTDTGGREGPPSNTVVVTPHDSKPPDTPASFAVTAPAAGASLHLSWMRPADPDLTGYWIYVAWPESPTLFVLLATLDAAATSYDHLNLSNGEAYAYVLVAFDEVSNESPQGAPATGTPRDTLPPAAPLLDVLPAATNVRDLRVTGTAPALHTVELFVGGAKVGTVGADAGGRFAFTLPLSEGPNLLTARSVDPAPSVDDAYKFSVMADPVAVIFDTSPPSVASTQPATGATGAPLVGGLLVRFSEAINVSTLQMTLTDSGGHALEGSVEYDPATSTATYTPAGPLRPAERYTLHVTAKDPAGNSLPTTEVRFETAADKGFLPGFEVGAALAALGATVLLVAGNSRRRLR